MKGVHTMKLTRTLAFSVVAGLAALAPGAGRAQTAMPSAYVNAPVVAPVLAPPPSRGGHCGVFETCANTKIGLGKGDFLIRLSAIGVMPEDSGSKIWLGGNAIPGRIKTTRQAAPEFTFEYFFTDNISADLIAASSRHEVAAEGTPVGHLDVGSAWVLPPTVTLAWHFRPHKRFNPYLGVGGSMVWFHNVSPAGGLVQKLNVGFTGGPAVNAGFDYQLVGNWFFNFDVKQIFIRMHAWANDGGQATYIKAHDSLDPTVVGAGIEYRF
jgi:outer membrane protein